MKRTGVWEYGSMGVLRAGRSLLSLLPYSHTPILLLALAATAPASAAPRHRAPAKPGAKPVALAIRGLTIAPASATLSGPRSAQHFIVTATLANGDTLDVTGRAVYRALSPKIARIAG